MHFKIDEKQIRLKGEVELLVQEMSCIERDSPVKELQSELVESIEGLSNLSVTSFYDQDDRLRLSKTLSKHIKFTSRLRCLVTDVLESDYRMALLRYISCINKDYSLLMKQVCSKMACLSFLSYLTA